MATERQIEANRRNAANSTGPKTEAGKARSRLNATKHGLAAELPEFEAELSPEFVDRRARWALEHRPVGEASNWALDRAVAASLRIERCERAMDDLCASTRQRAILAWDQDRAVEAATTFARLATDPGLTSCELQTTPSGVALLVESWLKLAVSLGSGEDWSEPECSKALDLLGVALDHRSGRTPIDDPDGGDPIAFRRALALEEIERLETLRDEALDPLDEMDRRRAEAGDLALLSRPAKLLLRYERDAWRRYRESIRRIPALYETPAPRVVAEAPAIVATPEPPSRPASPPSPTFEETRRYLLAQAAPITKAVTDRLVQEGFHDEDAWIDELERRIEASTQGRGSSTERTRFEVPAGVGS